MTPDPETLRRWLGNRLGPAPVVVRRIGGGQSNPTWAVRHGPRRLVLRQKPAGPILPGAHAIEREFRVLRALAGSDVPVPRALWLEEDPGILGTPFYVMDHVDGRVIADATLPGLSAADRGAVYADMARVLARLHAIRPDAVGLGDFGRPGDYFARQLARWGRQYRDSPGGAIPALDDLQSWLTAHRPPDDGTGCLTHGDFRLGNLVLAPDAPRIVAVLDWELSTLGHPLADLGYAAMAWHTAPEDYGGLLGTDWAQAGIPSPAAFAAAYHAHAVPTPPLAPFHIAFALFRFAVIFVGIADRARAGSAASADAGTLAPLADRLARRGLAVIAAAGG